MDDYGIFAAVIFVTESEREAVMRMYEWDAFTVEGDAQEYFRHQHRKGIIVCAQQDEMGMTASATLTTKMIWHFKPRFVVMPGIAAGTMHGRSTVQTYGDVVLADMVWNYSNGKYVPKDCASIVFGEVGFVPRPTVARIDEALIPIFEQAINSSVNQTRVHVGPIASGSAVVANREILDKQIASQYKTTKGLEMEGYGVAYAVAHSIEPRPKAIIAKSVCDFADSRKSDIYQKFAAHTSCEFLKLLIDEYL